MPVISKSNPVNWGHPLNKGRVAWWRCLDGTGTGYQWRDLCRGLNASLLNGARPHNNLGFSGTQGTIYFDGSNDYASVSHHPLFNMSTAITFGCSFYATAVSTGSWQHLMVKNVAALWSSPFMEWGVRINNGNRLEAFVSDSTYSQLTGPTVSAKRWYRVLVTYDGTTLLLYLDGIQSATLSTSKTITNYGFPINIGSRVGPGEVFGGNIDNATVYNRTLSANEVAQDYTLSRLGYPGVLNRLSNKVYFTSPSVTGNWHYYQQQYALMGAA